MVQNNISNEVSNFDKIIETLNSNGFFQKRYTWIFNFLLIAVINAQTINKVICLNVPDHWCHVPGRNNTNYTMEEWKKLTIPMETNSKGRQSYSQCTRYANTSIEDSKLKIDRNMIIKCDQGWEYDRTWYDMTTSMQEDWVCENSMIPSNGIAVIYAGDVFASLIYGQVADKLGRLPIFYLSLTIVIFTRIITIFTSSYLYVFMFFTLISAQIGTVIQNAMTIGMEISNVENRAFISMLVIFSMSLGMMISPLFMWWLRHWVTYSLVTTLPSIIFLFSWPWIIESPRWLVSRGKIKRCISELEKIARINKTKLPTNIEEQLMQLHKNQGDGNSTSITGFFSSFRLSRNTLILTYCFTVSRLLNACFTLSVTNMGGNPYLNYFYQALFELPGFLSGKFVSDRFGRRLVTVKGYILITLGSFILAFLIQNEANDVAVYILSAIVKGSLSITFYSIYLQSLELYPTCIRQTGVSLGLFFSNLLSIPAPYIVLLGVTVNPAIPYYIYGVLALIAVLASFFLPETLGEQLPETLNDAAIFGADQNFMCGRKTQKSL